VLAAERGADIVRVHDVTETVRALRVADAVIHGMPAELRDAPAPGPTG
jgi:dihydropteroate synthase